MLPIRISRVLPFVALMALAASRLSADSIETRNGARIVGKIEKIENGAITVATDFAGKITVKQSEVTALTTEEPVAVRLSSGTRLDGRVTAGVSRVAPGTSGA